MSNFKQKFPRWQCSADNGFLVQWLFRIFYDLEKISVFYWIRVIDKAICKRIEDGKRAKGEEYKKKPFTCTYIFPEIWAVSNVFVAYLGGKLLQNGIITNSIVCVILMIYSVLRVFEMFVYQINVMFFHRMHDQYEAEKPADFTITCGKNSDSKTHRGERAKEGYYIKSATRIVLLLMINMMDYILQFALTFRVIALLSGTPVNTLGVRESFEMFMNLSAAPAGGHIPGILIQVAQIEVAIGIFMNLVCLARFVGLLPAVQQLDNN